MSATFENSSSASAETTPAEASTGASGAVVADPGTGACAPGTLQDFVLNIINDDAAKAAYLADPTAALGAAGLGDLTAADVQEVLPLVADGLPTDLAALPVGALPVGDLPLDGLLGDLPLDLPTGLPSLGALPVVGDLPVAGALPGLGALPTAGLPAVGDLGNLTGGLPAVGALPGLGDLPVDLPAVGDLPVVGGGLPGLGDLPVNVPAVGDLPGLGALPSLGALPTGAGLPAPGDLPVVGDLPVSLPAAGLPVLGDLPLDLPAVGELPSLDNLPVDLPVALPDGGLGALPAVGDLPTAGLPGLGALPVDVPSLDLPSIPTLSTPLGDATAVVDGVSGLATTDLDMDLLDSASAGLLSNSNEGGAPTLSSHTESLLGDLAAGAKLAPEEFGGSVAGSSPLADVGGGLVGHVGGDIGAWAGADTVAGDVAAGVLGGPDGLAVAAESPLGSIAANSNGDFSIEPANAADLLDVDNLGTTGDVVAGTVAHYVSSGAGVLADGVDSGADTLGGYLTGSAGTVNDTIQSTTDVVTGGIHQGGDLVSEHLTNLPTTDALPLDQLPELPQVPDLPDVNSSDLPGLGDVTSHLPVSLPDTSGVTDGVTDLVSNNPVTDAVHSSPVGGLVDDVTGHLPQVGDLPVDLGHLGL